MHTRSNVPAATSATLRGMPPGAPYDVVLSSAARRQLRKLPRHLQQLAGERLDQLRDDPRGKPWVRNLVNHHAEYRAVLRDGYRIVFDINDDDRQVLVAGITKHDDAY